MQLGRLCDFIRLLWHSSTSTWSGKPTKDASWHQPWCSLFATRCGASKPFLTLQSYAYTMQRFWLYCCCTDLRCGLILRISPPGCTDSTSRAVRLMLNVHWLEFTSDATIRDAWWRNNTCHQASRSRVVPSVRRRVRYYGHVLSAPPQHPPGMVHEFHSVGSGWKQPRGASRTPGSMCSVMTSINWTLTRIRPPFLGLRIRLILCTMPQGVQRMRSDDDEWRH